MVNAGEAAFRLSPFAFRLSLFAVRPSLRPWFFFDGLLNSLTGQKGQREIANGEKRRAQSERRLPTAKS